MRTALSALCALAVLLLALTTVLLRGCAHADAAVTADCRQQVTRMDRRERLLRARLTTLVAELAARPDLTQPETLR